MGPREDQEWPLVNSSRANLQFSVCQQQQQRAPPSASATQQLFLCLCPPLSERFFAKGEKAKGQPQLLLLYTAARGSQL